MDSIDNLLNSLTPSERKILPLLNKTKEVNSLISLSGLNETQVSRSLLWLQDKKILNIKKCSRDILDLDENGKLYIKQQLPERRFLNSLEDNPLTLNEIKNKTNLNDDELRISIGILKKKDSIELKDKICLKENGKRLLNIEFPEEKLLKKLPLELNKLTSEENLILQELKRRRSLIKLEKITSKSIILTELGIKLTQTELKDDLLESLTVEMLKTGSWKNKEFRHYNINSTSPKIYGGRIHPLSLVIKNIKDVFVSMGFKEMKGPWVETAFWCMDSMWIPQDHPSREVQDTFYLPYKGLLPNELIKKVSDVHEHGGRTGSKGYKYKWNPEIAKQLILRTHTTATTYRYFHQKKIQYPAKYFCVGRVFRNESIDQTHLPEFHQVEGFVMDENLTLKDLMGCIKEFYSKLGVNKIKFKPVYNPYTEPSIECYGYNEELKKWVELINSGIFRPESLEPYGIKVPVIAWGFGVERLAMMLHKRTDIRDILGNSNDINWLRNYKLV